MLGTKSRKDRKSKIEERKERTHIKVQWWEVPSSSALLEQNSSNAAGHVIMGHVIMGPVRRHVIAHVRSFYSLRQEIGATAGF